MRCAAFHSLPCIPKLGAFITMFEDDVAAYLAGDHFESAPLPTVASKSDASSAKMGRPSLLATQEPQLSLKFRIAAFDDPIRGWAARDLDNNWTGLATPSGVVLPKKPPTSPSSTKSDSSSSACHAMISTKIIRQMRVAASIQSPPPGPKITSGRVG